MKLSPTQAALLKYVLYRGGIGHQRCHRRTAAVLVRHGLLSEGVTREGFGWRLTDDGRAKLKQMASAENEENTERG